MSRALENLVPRAGHIPHNTALEDSAMLWELRRLHQAQTQPMTKFALKELQLNTWLWKSEPFRECIREHFGCEPEALLFRDYNAARQILSDINNYNKFHY